MIVRSVMTWYLILILTTSLVNFSNCINRPVFKIVLTQKGFAQFLQYDVETPPIREFTFCTWLRVFDLSREQNIFTYYVANSNNRVIQLWLDSGGKFMKISLNGKISSSTLVDINKNTWRHICVSYQADFGAWAIYLDGRLASCEAAQSLYGFILPGGGSVIIGYGTTASGTPNGLEGEIFGANMILKSTIERNYTIKRDPHYQQKLFHKNKLLGNTNIKYTVLNDMAFNTVPDNYETTELPLLNRTESFIKLRSTYNLFEHDVGLDLIPKRTGSLDSLNEKEILDFTTRPKKTKSKKENEKINFWNLLKEASNIGKFTEQSSLDKEQSGSGTQELPAISEYETPPPPRPQAFQDYTHSNIKFKKPIFKTLFELKENDKVFNPSKINDEYEVSEVVKPPPFSKNTKVYGQWTSSQFANSVLNYLKNVNLENKKLKKVPLTIPLIKISDNLPYASDNRVTKAHLPFKFERRNILNNVINKRDTKHPQINVEILNEDLRTQILDSHAKTLPKNVDIINRGQNIKSNKYHRFYRNVDSQVSSETIFGSKLSKLTPFLAASKIHSNKPLLNNGLYKNSNLLSILPFLKSAEYFIEDSVNKKSNNSREMYTKSLSNANLWHNIKSYNNDYTPRHINMYSDGIRSSDSKNIDSKTANNIHPLLRLKYKPDTHKVVKNIDELEINNGRTLALEISNLSNAHTNSVSILKYNHGFLPNSKSFKNNDSNFVVDNRNKNISKKNNFNQHIKIGNALNERYVIGDNEKYTKISFIGGSEQIPDINRYRSEIDQESEIVPSSLGPKICKNVELYDRLLYVQPDGSVDITHILSPVKEKNLGIEFIIQNFKKCSLEESLFEQNTLLFIDWSKTPVRLFGGSYPKKTTDLCGFF